MHADNKAINHKNGFTVIELLVTLGLLTIILSVVFAMQSFGYTSFNNGSVKSNIQSNLRLAADYITKELRYSTDATLLTSMPSVPDTAKKYIYIDNGILKNLSGGSVINILGNISNITTNVQFQINNSKTVNFSIQETSKNQTFKIDSNVLLLNIGTNILASGTGAVICYTPGKPNITNINARPVESISIAASSNTISVSGGTLELKCNFTPADPSINTVTWTINDNSLATIDAKGLLKTKTNEINKTIIVTATAQDGTGVSSTYTVTTANSSNILLTALTIDSDPVADSVFDNGGQLQMVVKSTTPYNATNKTVAWTVDDTTAVTINADTGYLKTIGLNSEVKTITVTATAKDGSGKTATKNITIKPTIPKPNFTVDNTSNSTKLILTATNVYGTLPNPNINQPSGYNITSTVVGTSINMNITPQITKDTTFTFIIQVGVNNYEFSATYNYQNKNKGTWSVKDYIIKTN